jgi:Zn-dependent protease
VLNYLFLNHSNDLEAVLSFDWGTFILQLSVFALAITVHESAHAWSANRLGDPTARLLGRISLNPMVHVDIFGTVIFPIMLHLMGAPIIGWAKPVPVNVMNLRRPKRDSAWVSAAGPLSNLAMAVGAIILFRGLMLFDQSLVSLLGLETVRGVFTLIINIVVINFILAAFNLIPIPPLDGGGILAGILPDRMLGFLDMIQPYGFMILYLLLFTKVIGLYLGVFINLAYILLGI